MSNSKLFYIAEVTSILLHVKELTTGQLALVEGKQMLSTH